MKNLETSLKGFLKSRVSQEERARIKGGQHQPLHWVRFKQKPLDKTTLLVHGEFHHGSHKNLMVYTDNPKSLRSEAAEARIKESRKESRPPRSYNYTTKPAVATPWGESQWKDAYHWGGASWGDCWSNNDQWHRQRW